MPFFLLLVILLRHEILAIAEHPLFPDCYFYTTTGYLCPACGNTRAVLALLHGHLLQSLLYNPMIVVLAAALFCLYLEMVCCAFGKSVRILPRSMMLFYVVLGTVLTYDIVRNFIPALAKIYI